MKTGIALFLETLSVLSPAKARELDDRLRTEADSRLEAVYALVWPDYDPPVPPVPQTNRAAWAQWRADAGVPLWAWLNARADQDADVAAMQTLDAELSPDGWLLDIEGRWTQGTNLTTLAQGCAALGRPRRASLAGASASHVYPDFRALDLAGFEIDWQNYLDSGEGPPPSAGVRELYRSSFVHEWRAEAPWEYRHRLGKVYGWGKVASVENGTRAVFDSYRRPGQADATLAVGPRDWGSSVLDGKLYRDGKEVGLLMGRCEYARIRSTLDVTRGAWALRSLDEWTALAASARFPGAKLRPSSIYVASEHPPFDVIVAIAKGAA